MHIVTLFIYNQINNNFIHDKKNLFCFVLFSVVFQPILVIRMRRGDHIQKKNKKMHLIYTDAKYLYERNTIMGVALETTRHMVSEIGILLFSFAHIFIHFIFLGEFNCIFLLIVVFWFG